MYHYLFHCRSVYPRVSQPVGFGPLVSLGRVFDESQARPSIIEFHVLQGKPLIENVDSS